MVSRRPWDLNPFTAKLRLCEPSVCARVLRVSFRHLPKCLFMVMVAEACFLFRHSLCSALKIAGSGASVKYTAMAWEFFTFFFFCFLVGDVFYGYLKKNPGLSFIVYDVLFVVIINEIKYLEFIVFL